MTEKRKDELLTAALKLIGTHLDEDENKVIVKRLRKSGGTCL